MEIGEVVIFLNIISLFTTLILVGITAWYAFNTAKMLKAMKIQSEVMREQRDILLKSVQVSAWAALINAAGHPAGQNPIIKLRSLTEQLESLE